MLALASARRQRTLLVTTDPAPSLASVLNVPVGPEPAAVRGVPALWGAAVDSARAFSTWLAPRRELVAEIALAGTYLDSDDIERFLKLSLPGIDEVIGLLQIFTLATTWQADEGGPLKVVIDTAPTGHTLRLFNSPALFARLAAVLDTLQAHHRTVVTALRGFYAAEPADGLVAQMAADADGMAKRLRDPASTDFVWVTLPEPAALAETADAVSALATSGIQVGRLIVNRLTRPPDRPCAWCDARRQFEARALAPVARRFRGRDIQALPAFDAEPRGVPQLRRAVRALGPYRAPAETPPLAHRQRAPQPIEGVPARRSPALDLAGAARWILVGGKGGVGKSTCAAAVALQLAASHPGQRILLLSTDPAHSIGDILGARFDDRARAIVGAPPNLFVREIDAVTRFDEFKRQYVDSVDAAFAGLSKAGDGNSDTFRQLIDLAPPGVDEVIAVADVAAALADPSGPHLIVTDTAPTGHALRLLQTPAVLHDWVKALMAVLLKYRDILGAGSLATLLVDLSKRLRLLQATVRDPALTRFIVVTRAAAVPMEESRALERALSGLGIAIAGIIVNAMGAGSCTRCRNTIARQKIVLADLRAPDRTRPRHCAIIEAPAEVPPPHGPDALIRWSAAWRRLALPTATA